MEAAILEYEEAQEGERECVEAQEGELECPEGTQLVA